jgi:formate dehydrogenase subunit delta
MTNADLVRKANQIAAFFAAYPASEGLNGVLDHMGKFWEPRMRRQLVAYVSETGGEGLSPLALDAAKALGEEAQA